MPDKSDAYHSIRPYRIAVLVVLIAPVWNPMLTHLVHNRSHIPVRTGATAFVARWGPCNLCIWSRTHFLGWICAKSIRHRSFTAFVPAGWDLYMIYLIYL